MIGIDIKIVWERNAERWMPTHIETHTLQIIWFKKSYFDIVAFFMKRYPFLLLIWIAIFALDVATFVYYLKR